MSHQPWTIRPLPGGTNKQSYTVHTPDGSYVLCVYGYPTDITRLRFEHDLLIALAARPLPFAVPAPLPTHSGEYLLVHEDNLELQVASLCCHIPGQHLNGSGFTQLRACGVALAELDQALGELQLSAPSPPIGLGDLTRLHPAVAAPLSVAGGLPLTPNQRNTLVRLLDNLANTLPTLYRALPQQLVHRDVDASNVLMDGDRVSGVLDFEFAGWDARVFDLARSLSTFAANPWSTPDGVQRLRALMEGYRGACVLTREELMAIPPMMRLYRAWSLIHREGRRREGRAQADDVLARAIALLRQEELLETHIPLLLP